MNTGTKFLARRVSHVIFEHKLILFQRIIVLIHVSRTLLRGSQPRKM